MRGDELQQSTVGHVAVGLLDAVVGRRACRNSARPPDFGFWAAAMASACARLSPMATPSARMKLTSVNNPKKPKTPRR